MANDTITVTYKVKEDGSLEKISKNAKKAAKSTDEAAKAQGRFNKGQKGVAGATSNGTKAFSKMRSEMGGSSGVVAAYATFAANVFALTAAFGALQRAAQLKNLEAGFSRLANTVGRTSSMMAASIQDLTDGAISFDQAMRTASTGFSAGMTMTEIEGLTQVARGAATALGRDMPDALDRLVRGTAKLEPEILDELGIFVKIDDAVKDYATTLGKSATSLTATERRQAFLNATLEQGKKKFGAISDNVDVNVYDQLASNFDKIAKSALNLFSTVLAPVISFLANNTTALIGVLVLFASTLATSMFPALGEMAKRQVKVAQATKLMADSSASAGKRAAVIGTRDYTRSDSIKKKDGGDFKAITELKKQLKKGTVETKQFKKALSTINSTMTRTKNIAKKNGTLHTKEHKKRMAALKREEQQILNVQKARAGKHKSKGDSAFRTADAEGQQGVAGTLGQMEGMGAKDSWTKASEGFKDYKAKHTKGMTEFKKGSGFWSKMGKNILGGFKLGGVGARLFGAALVNSIPLIGQIIFLAGLLIQGLTSLWKAFTKPTKAQAQMNEITDKLKDKLEQLKETNEGLTRGYQALQMELLISKEGINGITEEQILAAMATADLQAKVKSYANSLQVASGVVGEYASAVSTMRKEITDAAAEEGGTEGGILAVIGNELGDAGDWMGGVWDSVVDGTVEGGKAAIKASKDAWGAVGDGMTDGVAFLSNTVGDGSLAKSMEMADVQGGMDTFSRNVTSNFAKIKEQLDKEGIGHLVENAFGPERKQSLEEYLAAQLKLIDRNADAKTAQEQLNRVMVLVEGEVSRVSQSLKTNSDAINKFSENTKDAAANMSKFVTSAKDSNKYTKLGENLNDIGNAVKALKTASLEDKSPSFAELLTAQLEESGIKLEDYGTTFNQVVDSVNKGEEPFNALAVLIKNAADETANAKANMQVLKDSLKSVQEQFKQGLADTEFKRSLKNLKKYGKFEVGDEDKTHKQSKDHYEATLKFLEDEAAAKKLIIDQEIKLQDIKLNILLMQTPLRNAQDEEIEGAQELRDLYNAQLNALKAQAKAKRGLVDQSVKSDTQEALSDYYKSESDRVARIGSAAGTGSTTADRMENFNKAGGFAGLDLKDEEGNPLKNAETGATLTNIGGKMAAVTAQLEPMFENLKKLGPEGELVAAITAGSLAMGEAFGDLADKMAAGTAKTSDKLAAVGAMISSIASITAASSRAKIAGIDKEIAAEQKRDGKSAGSLAKIASLKKKKEQSEKKAFEMNKKMSMAGVIINTAGAIMKIMEQGGIYATPMAVAVGALGAAQLAIIAGTSYQGGSASAAAAPSAVSMGSRSNTVDLGKGNNAGGELAYMRGESGQGTGATNFKPTGAFTGYKHRAGGGYIVGEQGPELFMPDVPGEIIASGQGTGGSTNVSFNIQAVDAAGVEEVLLAQKGHIIGMIREAANEHGQEFFEDIRLENYSR